MILEVPKNYVQIEHVTMSEICNLCARVRLVLGIIFRGFRQSLQENAG